VTGGTHKTFDSFVQSEIKAARKEGHPNSGKTSDKNIRKSLHKGLKAEMKNNVRYANNSIVLHNVDIPVKYITNLKKRK
jgi:hypothetical protein